MLHDDRALGRQVPRDFHLVASGGVDAAQNQRLPVLLPAHVGERRWRGGRRVGGATTAVGGRRVRSRLTPDEEVLVLGVAGVGVDDQVEAGGVVGYEVHDGGGLHPDRLRRKKKAVERNRGEGGAGGARGVGLVVVKNC